MVRQREGGIDPLNYIALDVTLNRKKAIIKSQDYDEKAKEQKKTKAANLEKIYTTKVSTKVGKGVENLTKSILNDKGILTKTVSNPSGFPDLEITKSKLSVASPGDIIEVKNTKNFTFPDMALTRALSNKFYYS